MNVVDLLGRGARFVREIRRNQAIVACTHGLLTATASLDREEAWLQQHAAAEAERRAALRSPLRDAGALLLAQLEGDDERAALLLRPYQDVECLRHLLSAIAVVVATGVEELGDLEAACEVLEGFLHQLARAE